MRKSARDELRSFLSSYLFPLLGIPSGNKDTNLEECSHENKQFTSSVEFEDENIYFCVNKSPIFRYHYPRGLISDNLRLARCILDEFFKVAKYYTSDKSVAIKNHYESEIQKDINYQIAIQNGICNWVIGSKNSNIYELMAILEKWSVQTYEGKKVTFGFVINPDIECKASDESLKKWKSFLKDDYAATLTDCIHSVIELDKSCYFSRYLSISDGDHVEGYSLNKCLPYRFASVIQRFVTDNKVGIFLLNNGDILLSKNQQICFVKRNMKWLNLSYRAFTNVLQRFRDESGVSDSVLSNIFASTLDVSFAHTGGIIAVVKQINKLTEVEPASILGVCDDLTNGLSEHDLRKKLSELNVEKHDIEKRLCKRDVLTKLLSEKNFMDVDRKLRTELISMDGACIIDTTGRICSFGAIIQNDSGSSAGGRGAASKKLSKFGIAIKISTDGYIELYDDGKIVYSIK